MVGSPRVQDVCIIGRLIRAYSRIRRYIIFVLATAVAYFAKHGFRGKPFLRAMRSPFGISAHGPGYDIWYDMHTCMLITDYGGNLFQSVDPIVVDMIERRNGYRICQWDVRDLSDDSAEVVRVPSPRPRPTYCYALCWCDFRSASPTAWSAHRRLSEDEAEHLRNTDGFPDWDYVLPDDECPFEYKASDWGRLPDGRLGCVGLRGTSA
jgi:hypothetical protein